MTDFEQIAQDEAEAFGDFLKENLSEDAFDEAEDRLERLLVAASGLVLTEVRSRLEDVMAEFDEALIEAEGHLATEQ